MVKILCKKNTLRQMWSKQICTFIANKLHINLKLNYVVCPKLIKENNKKVKKKKINAKYLQIV